MEQPVSIQGLGGRQGGSRRPTGPGSRQGREPREQPEAAREQPEQPGSSQGVAREAEERTAQKKTRRYFGLLPRTLVVVNLVVN